MITKIAHITDLHLDDKISGDFTINARLNTSRIIDSIVNEKIKHVVITGDLGLSTSFEWLNNVLYKRELIVYYAMGNHDDIAIFKNREEYLNSLIKNKLIYNIEINKNNLLIFDTSSGEIDSNQINKIGQVVKLKESCILFSHYPILDCGNTIMDQLFPLKNREVFIKYLNSNFSNLVYFCGHYHNSFENKSNNITQYVTPSASLQISKYANNIEKENNLFGYRIIEIENTQLVNTELIMMKN